MKPKNCLIFGGSGQIGRNLIRKLTKNNYKITVVTRNIHQKSYKIKTQANAGYIDIKLHKNDLPDDLNLGNVIAVDGEFMGLNVRRDPLCLIQISSLNNARSRLTLVFKNFKLS